MGVYIKGMEMPKACFACKMLYEPYWECRVHGNANHSTECRPTDCPLVPVPPHGRLIDADTCEDYFYEHLSDAGMAGAMNAINEMPTIIPAEEE